MRKTLPLLAVLTFSAATMASSVDVSKVNSYYGGEQGITLTTTVSAISKSFILPEMNSRIKAIKKAKGLAADTLAGICTNGIRDGYLSHDTQDCSVVNSKTNEVQCTVETNALCNSFEGIKSRAGLRLKLGNIAASTACVDAVDEKYSVDNEIINNCNKIKNEIQFECVEILTRYNSVKTYAISECGKFKSQHSLNVMRHYAGEGDDAQTFEAPSVQIVTAFSKVDSVEEEACFKNKMKLGSINALDLTRSCTNEIKETIDEARQSAGSLMDRVRDFFSHD